MKIKLYLYRLLFTKITVISMVLMLILWIVRSLKLIDTVVSKGVNITDFFQLSLYLFPYILYNVLPFAAVIGCLIVFRLLKSDNELLVMRLFGVSKYKILRSFSEVLLFFTIIGWVISIFIIPFSYNKFQQILFQYQSQYLATFVEDKAFNSDISGLTFYIENKAEDSFQGVFINDYRNPSKNITIFAESGMLKIDNSAPSFILNKGVQFEYDLEKNTLTTLSFDKYNLVFDYGKAIKQIKDTEHQELTVIQLLTISPEHEYYDEFKAEGIKRLTWPTLTLFAPILLLMAIFNEKFSRNARLLPTVVGVCLSFIFILANVYTVSLAHSNWMIMLLLIFINSLLAVLAFASASMEKIKGW